MFNSHIYQSVRSDTDIEPRRQKMYFSDIKSLQSTCLFWSPLGMNNTALSWHEIMLVLQELNSSNVEFNGLMTGELGDRKERGGKGVGSYWTHFRERKIGRIVDCEREDSE